MTEEPSSQLYQFLRARFRHVGEAHRTNPRRNVSTPARLSWTDGERDRTVRARLLDISRAGAALIVLVPPPLKIKARLRLVGPEPTPWLEVEILGVEPDSPGRHKIRLRFKEPCPTYFLRVAVLGPIGPDEESRDHCATIVEPIEMPLNHSPTHTPS
jgi:hypothetical protein